jgi:hypothetical protein
LYKTEGDYKTAYYKLLNHNELFTNIVFIGWPSYAFSGDYYVRNVDPSNLKEELEKTLRSANKLSPELRSKLTKLKDSITENDNNYILYAKLKK